MSEIWFTSDLHFGHEKAAKARGFETIEEHDEHFIGVFNALLTKHDKLYIIGDVAIRKSGIQNLARIPGYKTIVLGNHDKGNARAFMSYPNVNIEGAASKSFGEFRTVITHIPIHPDEFYRWDLNIHGHLHEKVISVKFGMYPFKDPRYFNVSPERWGNRPVHADYIIKHIESMQRTHE